MKKCNVAIISHNDTLWSLYAWNKTLPKICSKEHYNLKGFWVCEEKFSSLKKNEVMKWYLNTFLPWNFFKLGMFYLAFKFRNMLEAIFDSYQSSYKELCNANKVQYNYIANPNSIEFSNWLKENNIDILVIMVGHILKPHVISSVRLGIVNKHAALLPSNKGIFPYFWAKKNEEPQGISFHIVDDKIDNGSLLYQEKVVKDDQLSSMVSFYLHTYKTYGDSLLISLENLIEKQTVLPIPETPSSYFGLPTRTDYINFKSLKGRIITWNDLFKIRKL